MALVSTYIKMAPATKAIFIVEPCGGNARLSTPKRVKSKGMKEKLMRGLLMESEFCITRMESSIRGTFYKEQSTDMEYSFMALRSINAYISWMNWREN